MRLNPQKMNILKCGLSKRGIHALTADLFYERSASKAIESLIKEGLLYELKEEIQRFKTTEKGKKLVYEQIGFDPEQVKIEQATNNQ